MTYNAGVCVRDEDSTEYYGVLREIIQLQYPGSEDNTVILFNCKWFNSVSNRGIRRHPQYGIIEINVKEDYPKDEPFILAQHASQVFYLPYPSKKKDKINWRVVINIRPRSRIDQRYNVLQEPNIVSPSIINIDPQEQDEETAPIQVQVDGDIEEEDEPEGEVDEGIESEEEQEDEETEEEVDEEFETEEEQEDEDEDEDDMDVEDD